MDDKFDLDSILDEFRGGPKSNLSPPESVADRSRRLVMKTMDDAFGAGDMELLGGLIEETAETAPPPVPPPPVPEGPPEPGPAADEDELEALELTDDLEEADYAAPDSGTPPEGAEPEADDAEAGGGKDARKEPFLSPFVAILALIALRRERRARGEGRRPTVEREGEAPEMEPKKAVRLYGSQARSLRLRARIATGLTLAALYLTFAYDSFLPLTGALKSGVRVISLLLLILEGSVVMAGLDVFTGGLLGIPRGRMGAESLIAVSCVLSMLDAAALAAMNRADYGLPYCAAGAVSMTFALWGAYYTCRGRRDGFQILAAGKNVYTVAGEIDSPEGGVLLFRSRKPPERFITRSEEADLGEYVYGLLTPFLLIAAPVLGLLSSLFRGRAGAALHCVSAIVTASASFSCAVCFSVPFAVLARRLAKSGAAVSGWSGLRDIGKSRRIVITDADVFPKGTVEVGKIRILEGYFAGKVISYTGSVVAASGSCLSGAFADLIRRNGYSMCRVENFEPHDGGGITAVVAGESVCVGSAGFMSLMGIRPLPNKLLTDTSLCAAVNGALVGIFEIHYQPIAPVQDALVLLLRSRMEPVFAVRDFNVTPVMLKERFKLPTDVFRFPSYAERYRVSGLEPGPDSRVSAVLAKDGMGPLVEAAELGRRTHLGVRVATAVSALGSLLGLIVLFLLCFSGAFDSAGAGNVVTFMLLWLIPAAVVTFGLTR